jgi:Niemann-Pick C1 protein
MALKRLSFHSYDERIFLASSTDTYVLLSFQQYSSAEKCMSAFKAPLDPSTALGGFPGNNYSEVIFHPF